MFVRVYEKEGVGESMLVCVCVCVFLLEGGILFTVSYPWVASNPCSFNIFFKIGQISFFLQKKTFFNQFFTFVLFLMSVARCRCKDHMFQLKSQIKKKKVAP